MGWYEYSPQSGMKQRLRYFTSRISILLLGCLLTGCDVLLDIAVACVDDDRPVLSPPVLPNPILNQVYDQNVHVGIQNEPFDDAFDYSFELTGALPAGLQYEVLNRDLRILGTPTELGDYSFSVRVEVVDSGFHDLSGLCATIDTIGYSWTVQPM